MNTNIRLTRDGRAKRKHLLHKVEGVASGMALGAAIGSAAGPPGMVAGALIGGVSGALAAAALDIRAEDGEERTRELDDVIGVNGGTIGAPNLKHPPANLGGYSAAASGAEAPSGEPPAEGPMQTPE